MPAWIAASHRAHTLCGRVGNDPASEDAAVDNRVRATLMLISGQIAAIGVAVNRLILRSRNRDETESDISRAINRVADDAEGDGSADRRNVAKGLREQLNLMVGANDGKDGDSSRH